MALTDFQRSVCRLLAQSRILSGESYLAGGATLNELLQAARVSRDVDLFHDTESALDATWQSDRRLLEQRGFSIRMVRERPSFVEAEVSREGESVLVQWVRDSAYRFFPLVQHPELGLTLHPFDLATNKVLALVGRLEVRDWVDTIECSERLQPLGYLAWAACGKDPGFSPLALIEHAARTARYSSEEVGTLSFAGPSPDAADLSRRWHAELAAARDTVAALPHREAGKCVLDRAGLLFRGSAATLGEAVANDELRFHTGSIRGAFPQIQQGGSSVSH
jgi:hypothetical protein